MKTLLATIFYISFFYSLVAQPKTLDYTGAGSPDEISVLFRLTDSLHSQPSAMILTKNKEIIICGTVTYSSEEGKDTWFAKYDTTGREIWRFVNEDFHFEEKIMALAISPNGGFIGVGTMSSYGNRSRLGWIIRIDDDGNILWQKIIDKEGFTDLFGVAICEDGYYVSGSFLKEKQSNGLVLIINEEGKIEKNKKHIGGNGYMFNSMNPASGGEFIIAGSFFGATNMRGMLVKTNSSGAKKELLTYGNYSKCFLYYVDRDPEGGYVAAGSINTKKSGSDIWIVKTNEDLVKQWTEVISTENSEYPTSIAVQDSIYILCGSIHTPAVATSEDIFILKISRSGRLISQQNWGSKYNDTPVEIIKLSAGRYLIAATIIEDKMAKTVVLLVKE